MKGFTLLLVAICATVTVARTQEFEPGRDVAARVFAGGWFEAAKYRRNDQGVLEMDYFADVGGNVARPRWMPLCGDDFGDGLANAGALGYLALLYHGPSDLLAMTDADFHFGVLGVDVSDVGLRQYLARPHGSFDGAAGRAAYFDRLLAIETLVGRSCVGARAELTMLSRDNGRPELEQRASRALAKLTTGSYGVARRQLTADELFIPKVFDACLVVEHAKLPAMNWLLPGARRLGAEITATTVMRFGRPTTDAMRNGCQRTVDATSELPFALAHHYGNVRIDHSVLFVEVRPGERLPNPPFAISWQAAGAFAHEGWRKASLPETLGKMWSTGELQVSAERARGTVGKPVIARRQQFAEQLLRDRGAAVRVFVPGTSKLWPLLAAHDFPGPTHAELLLRFSDEPTLEVRVTAANEADATKWVERAEALRADVDRSLPRVTPDRLLQHAAFAKVMAALRAGAVSRSGNDAVATVALPKLTGPTIMAMLIAGAVDR